MSNGQQDVLQPITDDYAMLATQSRAREVSDSERELTDALIGIFRQGIHDFGEVVALLIEKRIPRPSGNTEPWSLPVLEEELRSLNDLFDEAYLRTGYGA